MDSTGNAQIFAVATRLCADRGRVILVGDTGSPSQQCLTHDVLNRGLHIIGTHDLHYQPNPEFIIGAFFDLLASNRMSLAGLNTHEFNPQDCLAAYTLANQRRAETMGILFNWTALS